jgi:hypothetical protein
MTDWIANHGESDGLGRDMELAEAFRALDPATHDPNYWLRFRGWVMSGAAAELARRRLIARLTVGDVLSSWARTLVPTAVLAAAVAAMLLVRASTVDQMPIALEELLVTEIPVESQRVLLAPPQSENPFSFVAESF